MWGIVNSLSTLGPKSTLGEHGGTGCDWPYQLTHWHYYGRNGLLKLKVETLGKELKWWLWRFWARFVKGMGLTLPTVQQGRFPMWTYQKVFVCRTMQILWCETILSELKSRVPPWVLCSLLYKCFMCKRTPILLVWTSSSRLRPHDESWGDLHMKKERHLELESISLCSKGMKPSIVQR